MRTTKLYKIVYNITWGGFGKIDFVRVYRVNGRLHYKGNTYPVKSREHLAQTVSKLILAGASVSGSGTVLINPHEL